MMELRDVASSPTHSSKLVPYPKASSSSKEGSPGAVVEELEAVWLGGGGESMSKSALPIFPGDVFIRRRVLRPTPNWNELRFDDVSATGVVIGFGTVYVPSAAGNTDVVSGSSGVAATFGRPGKGV